MFGKVLVANRGEIAVRVLRGLREAGIAGVAVYSEADRASLHVRVADEAVPIGPAASSESYLSMDRVLEAATATGADAIHPGYGFLSENAEFAARCRQAGLVFIGPGAEAIRSMGLKTEARRVAMKAGVAVVPGTEEPVSGAEQARRIAAGFGYPVMLKAAAGGGGKGMRRVDNEAALEAALRDATSEAERSFRDGSVYMEKLIERPRHIEIQVLADHHGNAVHLGERECSIQRRHQKVIEECPSPLMREDPDLRRRMGEAAVRIARAAGYVNAGTVEFLVDEERNFYFLEMNTRLQVEHPVTELVTGRDLVRLQLEIAAGQPLAFTQEEVEWNGAAIECRVCAEDPERQFLPCPGKITSMSVPLGPGVRLDSGVYPGWTVPMEYDPLLGKLVVWAETREQAGRRLVAALREFSITGIPTNLSFFRDVLEDEEFLAGRLHTGFIEELFRRRQKARTSLSEEIRAVAAVAAALHWNAGKSVPVAPPTDHSVWRTDGRARNLR
ncbi:MAG: acetyl-CoA carboxylase biotin carboxylase subunit [Acidimicrobiia bacterium]|nr:acetyl-CoA carboxylase biotin carboxylase subunit [Acidimicrobiia bacterium]